jgi:hypothetical protein
MYSVPNITVEYVHIDVNDFYRSPGLIKIKEIVLEIIPTEQDEAYYYRI